MNWINKVRNDNFFTGVRGAGRSRDWRGQYRCRQQQRQVETKTEKNGESSPGKLQFDVKAVKRPKTASTCRKKRMKKE